MLRRPPRSTRTTHSFPTRRSSDLAVVDARRHFVEYRAVGGGEEFAGQHADIVVRLGDPLHHRARLRLLIANDGRSEEHTSELQSLMRISYAVFCLKKKKNKNKKQTMSSLRSPRTSVAYTAL